MKNYSKSAYTKLKFIWFILFCASFICSILATLALYKFINPDNSNNILSENMLIAIKKYDVSIIGMFKKKLIYRLTEIIILVLLLLTKKRDNILNIMWLYLGLYTGFISTIFIKEMSYIGIINLIIIAFPHKLFYLATLFCLISLLYCRNNYINDFSTNNTLFDKLAPYINIILLWCCGILSETIINLFFVQKFFII